MAALERVAAVVDPAPYDEREAVADALAGRGACVHGHWPHQGGVCAECGIEAIAAVWKLFAKRAEPAPAEAAAAHGDPLGALGTGLTAPLRTR